VSVRRSLIYVGLTFSLAALAFSFGSWTAERSISAQLASNDARVTALRDDMARAILQIRQTETAATPSATNGRRVEVVTAGNSEPALVDEIKRQIQSEMGLLPVQLLRDRKESFVELNAYDISGKSSYGTAGYLGNGYFVTVKHAVVALDDADGREGRKITSIRLKVHGRDVPAHIVDTGDADVEVHSGDWAVVRVNEPVDLPALRVNASFSYDFADPIFRLGNDYSKGIILSTGYVGQRTNNGLVTCLTDGHPGVSGGGVLDQDGDLVGIPIGRMQGDYRFSFILPLRSEMFRKVPGIARVETKLARATN